MIGIAQLIKGLIMKYIIDTDDGNKYIYDTSNNKFYTNDGGAIIFVSDEKNIKKKIHIRISLGMACNMNCSYCSERQNRTKFIDQVTDAKHFTKSLLDYIDKFFDKPEVIHISFWGGEPLLYADIMQAIHKEMTSLPIEDRELQWSLSTNGKLLKGPVFRWIVDNKIQFSVSYDGPGQKYRDQEDVLSPGSVQLANLHRYLKGGAHALAFNPVLHIGNPSFDKYELFMQERLQFEDIPIGDAPYLRIYDDVSAKYMLSDDQLKNDMSDRINRINTDRTLPHSFYTRLRRSMTADEVPFPCITTNRENYLAVDLKGNIWGCHNNVGQIMEENGGNLYGGNIYTCNRINIPYVALTKRREIRCPDCLLRYICGGGCGLTPDKYKDYNCAIAWHINFPVFYQIVKFATLGGKLTAVQRIQEV